jgi:hypothetical protein
MATANEIITGAFGKAGIYQPEDDIQPESLTVALQVLNDYLNGLNNRGAVFPTVSLTINANVPVSDQQVRDLKWALAGELCSQWGKAMTAVDLNDVTKADRRFIAAYRKVYPATADAGLNFMPGRRRW